MPAAEVMLVTWAAVPGCELNVPAEPGVPGPNRYSVLPTGAGGGAVMVKGSTADLPPPGAGLFTATDASPVSARFAAGIVAVNCVALSQVVTRGVPFQSTVEVLLKFVPVRVMAVAALPAGALFVLRLVSVGTMLSAGTAKGIAIWDCRPSLALALTR